MALESVMSEKELESTTEAQKTESLDPTEQKSKVNEDSPSWGIAKLVLFRFAFVYLLIYNLDIISQFGFSSVMQRITDGYHVLIPFMAKHLLHLSEEITIFSNGSGDTTYDYVLVLFFFLVSILACSIWSILDRKRKDYVTLSAYLRLFVRVNLACALLSYGSCKVIQSQFPPIRAPHLEDKLGDFSPMGLLWTFMSYSQGYNIFTGSAEILGGILLMVPQWTLAGSLVGGAVMSNVFMLNMCYDVPVKLYSFHLLLMCIYLARPDLTRLIDFFFLQKPSCPVYAAPLFKSPRKNQIATLVQILFGIYVLSTGLNSVYSREQEAKTKARVFPSGMYTVNQIYWDAEDMLKSSNEEMKWKEITFDSWYLFKVETAEGKTLHYSVKTDDKTGVAKICESWKDKKGFAELRFSKLSQSSVELDGKWRGKDLHCKLIPISADKYTLTGRGFHWINEHPYNR